MYGLGVSMATQDDLDALHRVTAIPASDTTYTDEILAAMIDAAGSVSGAAATIWRERAASMAGLVDTTESGSSRKLSDLHKNALAMGAALDAIGAPVTSTGRSYTIPVERM